MGVESDSKWSIIKRLNKLNFMVSERFHLSFSRNIYNL